MPYLDRNAKELLLKIVYYGPGLSGKTTNVQFIHSQVASSARSELISLATAQDRTLYFDFLGIDAGQVDGHSVRIQLFTVPGQQPYNRTRKEVLRGVDGVVFVADSSKKQWAANIDSLNNLVDNLISHHIQVDNFPLVFQFNKRDVPDAMSIESMQGDLTFSHGTPAFESIALEGRGVMATLKSVIKLVVSRT